MAPVLVISLPRSLGSCVKYGKNHTRLCWGLNRRPVVGLVESGIRHKSSPATASLVEENTTTSQMDTASHQDSKDSLDLTFCDHEKAFKSKTSGEIIRALMVFKMCGIKFLVDNNEKLLKLGQKVLGQRIFASLMKASFYGHFVAGEDQIKIQPTLERLRSFGVKSILDYSVEEDISSETAERREME
ncbi:hypothetical protein Pcinc_024515 [Petrolisthes cinctipes]|uniref:Proline dehydrogenase n=1 Tax=Petrolisthes cinctipes TaxID=88211 RepID=A0AAE1F9T2_PETCI|nr:hypothetical protein Pcinc_024515 [Petrolisthes cinctipes]